MKWATEVIAVSEWMAFELQEYTGIMRERPVHVVPGGLSNVFNQNISTNISTKTPYILSVSSVLPHKNYESCVKIFASLKSRYKVPHILFVIGLGPKEYVASLKKLSFDLEVNDSVYFMGPIVHIELAKWYIQADAFILTSLCESLGFTVIEAMASGIPVIVSNKSGLPDTVANAGIIEDPFKTDVFADKLFKLLDDNNLREKYVQMGLKRASEFSWDKAAKDTMDIIINW